MQVAQGAAPQGGGQTPIAHQMALASPVAAQGGGDFWDVGDPDFVNQQLPQGGDEFSELVAVQTTKPRGRTALLVLLMVILAVTGWGAYEVVVEDQNPLDLVVAQATALYDTLSKGLFGDDAAPPPAVVQHVKKAKAPKPPVAAGTGGRRLKVKAGNPYWYLPNRLLGAPTELKRMWTPEEEETLRAGLAHRYTYQRYKTVQDVRSARHAGSEEVLREALQDKKLWTRMFAVVGLAEMNQEVPFKVLSEAVKGARSELVANFFERFVKHPSPAQLYVLREAVRGLDARGRIVALRGIHRSKDVLRDVYLSAATLDPDRHVQAWVRQALVERPIQPDRHNQLVAVIRGEAPADSLLHEVTARSLPKKKAKAAPETATAGDLDADGGVDQGDDARVEIYQPTDDDETDAKPALETPDPETFEYKN